MKTLILMTFISCSAMALQIGNQITVHKIPKGKKDYKFTTSIKRMAQEKDLKIKVEQRKLKVERYNNLKENTVQYNKGEITLNNKTTPFEIKIDPKGLKDATLGFILVGKRVEQVKGVSKGTHQSTFLVNIADNIKNDLEIKVKPRVVGKKTLLETEITNKGNAVIYRLKTRVIIVDQNNNKIGYPIKDVDPHFLIGPTKSDSKRLTFNARLKPGKYKAIFFMDSIVADLNHKEVVEFEIKKKSKKKNKKKKK